MRECLVHQLLPSVKAETFSRAPSNRLLTSRMCRLVEKVEVMEAGRAVRRQVEQASKELLVVTREKSWELAAGLVLLQPITGSALSK